MLLTLITRMTVVHIAVSRLWCKFDPHRLVDKISFRPFTVDKKYNRCSAVYGSARSREGGRLDPECCLVARGLILET
mgnify:CR=1 FL=1